MKVPFLFTLVFIISGSLSDVAMAQSSRGISPAAARANGTMTPEAEARYCSLGFCDIDRKRDQDARQRIEAADREERWERQFGGGQTCSDIFACYDPAINRSLAELEDNCVQRGICPTAADRTPGMLVPISVQQNAAGYIEQSQRFMDRARSSNKFYERQYLLAQSLEGLFAAVSLAPDSPVPYLMRAVIHSSFAPTDYQYAISDITNSINIRPTADAYGLLGDIRYAERDFQSAVENYNLALSLTSEPAFVARLTQARDNSLQIVREINAPEPTAEEIRQREAEHQRQCELGSIPPFLCL